MDWPLFIAMYVAGALAYGYYTIASLPAPLREIVSRGSHVAAGVALSFLGTSIIWPLGVLVLLVIRVADRRERAVTRQAVSDITDIMADDVIDAEFEALPAPAAFQLPCGKCGSEETESAYLGRIHSISSDLPGGGVGYTFRPEQYQLCDDCFDILADDLDESSKREPLPLPPMPAELFPDGRP